MSILLKLGFLRQRPDGAESRPTAPSGLTAPQVYLSILKKVAVIGAGFSGLSAAAYLAHAGYDVTVFEKNPTPGGRARQLHIEGFTFDMGPSWYWMPDVFENYFALFGKRIDQYYTLRRLDPSY